MVNKTFLLEGLACLVLLALGTVVQVVYEKKDFITSVYLTVQYVTTIGYGDIVPAHNETRIFLAFYVLANLVLFAHFLGVIVGNAQDAMNKKMEQGLSSENSSSAKKGMSSSAKNLLISTILFALVILFGTVFYGATEDCTCSYGDSLISGCDDSSYDICVLTKGATKDYLQSFYMSVITLTTVGLGDFVPQTEAGRWASILWMILGTAICGTWVGSVSAFFLERGQDAKQQVLKPDKPTVFKMMDWDMAGQGKGYLRQAEYRLFMLHEQGIVTKDMLTILDENFTRLSADRPGVSLGQLDGTSPTAADFPKIEPAPETKEAITEMEVTV